MKRLFFISLLGLLVMFLVNVLQAKRIYIVVDKARLRKSHLAIPPFINIQNDLLAKDVGKDLRKIVDGDLNFSGLFEFIVPKDMGPFQSRGYALKDINFKEWGALGTEFLIKGGFELNLDRVIFDVRLYDIKSGRLIVGKKYRAKRDNLRSLAHRFANVVIRELTGRDGIFQTKILFVSDKTGHKELYMMDFDGKNIEQITRSKSNVLAPAWAPDGKKIAYSAYETHRRNIKNIDLSVMDLVTRKRTIVSRRPGLNVGACWAPNGYDIGLTMSYQGNPEIYIVRPNGKNPKRRTKHGAIDVECDWSPDSKRIVFSSGRARQAHLYVMNRDGSGVRRLTFAGRYNSSPSWSPVGNQIVFAGQKRGSFDIYMVNVEAGGLRRLTKAPRKRHNESPSFSPDGRHIVFSSNRRGKYELYVINEDGSGERPLLRNFGNVTLPKWSPYMD